MTRKLFIPGPVDVAPDVLQQMNRRIIGHRGEEISKLLSEEVYKLKKFMYTDNNVFLSTSSSTGLMEAAARNCIRKKCLCLANGAFGKRWHEIVVRNGKQADRVEVEWGKAITPELVDEKLKEDDYDALTLVHNETSTGVCNPIYEISKVVKDYEVSFLVDSVSSMGGIKLEVDKLEIDVCLFGVQKAMALPPGLAICSVSDSVLEKAKEIQNRGYYFDFLNFSKYWKKRQTPTTPAIPQIYALNYQLDKIFEEGLENRYRRHKKMAEFVRGWAKKRFELFPEEKFASNTVTCVKNSRGIDMTDLLGKLQSRGYIVSNGYGKLKNKTFRIAHMGETTLDEVEELLTVIDDIIRE
ncbi:MAG: pyridoxal-phosphate-dependent aminotransferase family protein [Thermoproteota archaeon]